MRDKKEITNELESVKLRIKRLDIELNSSDYEGYSDEYIEIMRNNRENLIERRNILAWVMG